MGFLVSAGVYVDSGHEPPRRPPASAPGRAQNYAARVYPQDEYPAKLQSWVAAPVIPPRRPPQPLPLGSFTTRVYPVLEDVQQLMAWAGATSVVAPRAASPRPSGQDVLPVNVPAAAGVVPGWDGGTSGGARPPRPAAGRESVSYVPALAEAPGLTEMWASAPAVLPPRAARRPAAPDLAGPQPATFAGDLAQALSPWRVDVVAVPRREQPRPFPAGDQPLAALADVQRWLAAFVATPLPAGRAPRPAYPGHVDVTPWRGIDIDPISRAGLWAQTSRPRPPAAVRVSQDSFQLSTAQYAGLWAPYEVSQPPRYLAAARPTWTRAEAAGPSPVATHVIIIGGPYSVSQAGLYVASATTGAVLPL